METNYTHTHTLFPKIERTYCDPPLPNQTFALVSFVPAPNAKADENGVYGCMKIRGVYGTIQEADDRAEHLIQYVDSMQTILTTFVGRPFPIMAGNAQQYGAELRKIDVNKTIEEVDKVDREKKRLKEQKDIAEIKEREKLLKTDVATESKGKPIEERYTMARVKLSQLVFTAHDYRKRLDELKGLIVSAHNEVKAIETPELLEDYMGRYLAAREEAGLCNDKDEIKNSFMQYMTDENVDLDVIQNL